MYNKQNSISGILMVIVGRGDVGKSMVTFQMFAYSKKHLDSND